MEKTGFSLIEIAIVMGSIVILATIALIAIDPGERINQTRDIKRLNNISTINNAIKTYLASNGSFPNCSGTTPCPQLNFEITGRDPLSSILLNSKELKTIPQAPQTELTWCKPRASLYEKSEKKYRLSWCYESWEETDVQNLPGNAVHNNGSDYWCTWESAVDVAVCIAGINEKTNTVYEIPSP